MTKPQENRTVKPLRILVVDDHADTVSALAKLLKHEGYVTVGARSAKEARQAAERQPFDLLVSDIAMPEESGLELMRELKRKYGMTGIAVTGYAQPCDRLEALQAGYSAWFKKPFDCDALLQTIQQLATPNSQLRSTGG